MNHVSVRMETPIASLADKLSTFVDSLLFKLKLRVFVRVLVCVLGCTCYHSDH